MQNNGTKERAVLYCRVSTTDELQKSSLDAQQAEGKKLAAIQGWNLITIFAEQESGTNTEGRSQYRQMIRMIRNGEVDIVIVKSIDRLNRNEADWYDFLELIVKQDVKLFQVLENRFFDSSQDKLLSGIKAILAAEYSRELSKKINKAHRYRQEITHHVVLSSRTYALKSHGGVVTVDEREAAMVRRAYELFSEGRGATSTSNILFSEGYVNRNGNRLDETTLSRIISNPLFKGTAVFNKRRYDFEKKKTVYNEQKDWIIVENAVPRIVSDKLWNMANEATKLRVTIPKKPYELKKGSEGYNFRGKIYCGLCKEPYYRCFIRDRSKENHNMAKYVYRCKTYKYQGRTTDSYSAKTKLRTIPDDTYEGCDNIFIPEADLVNIVNEVAVQLIPDMNNDVLEGALSMLKSVLKEDKSTQLLTSIEKEIKQKKDEKYNALRLNLKKNVDPDLVAKAISDIEKEISQLKKKKQRIKSTLKNVVTAENRIADLQAMSPKLKEQFRKNQTLDIIEKIVIFPDIIKVYADLGKALNVNSNVLKNEVIEFDPLEWVHTMYIERQIKYNKIIHLINENPKQTVRQMAERINTPVQTVQNWIISLRRGGFIKYNRKNGRGYWEVLKPFGG